jgi:hypothetical protein
MKIAFKKNDPYGFYVIKLNILKTIGNKKINSLTIFRQKPQVFVTGGSTI